MKKIIVAKNKIAPPLRSAGVKQISPRGTFQPPASHGSGARWLFVMVILVVLGVWGLTAIGKAMRNQNAAMNAGNKPVRAGQAAQERLWMGEWMRQHGTVSNELLRARQERIKNHRSNPGR